MRFDDTNPTKEKEEFVDSIKADVEWLGADWEDRLFFASNYFEQMYEAAVKLIKKGKAYVSDLSAEQMKEYRGTLTEPGKEDPAAGRSIEENLQLFEDMRAGKFADGEKVLRARIDMASPNMNMRDPVIYRVAHMTHHNTGDKWCIYPMYDFAHPIEDAIEGITHSICTLEFEDHRPLYDWVVRELEYPHPPKQIEFAKLYLKNVVTGKSRRRAGPAPAGAVRPDGGSGAGLPLCRFSGRGGPQAGGAGISFLPSCHGTAHRTSDPHGPLSCAGAAGRRRGEGLAGAHRHGRSGTPDGHLAAAGRRGRSVRPAAERRGGQARRTNGGHVFFGPGAAGRSFRGWHHRQRRRHAPVCRALYPCGTG